MSPEERMEKSVQLLSEVRSLLMSNPKDIPEKVLVVASKCGSLRMQIQDELDELKRGRSLRNSEIYDLIELKEFIEDCEQGAFINSDGFGFFVKKTDDGVYRLDGNRVYPSFIKSKLTSIPEGTTHINWLNK